MALSLGSNEARVEALTLFDDLGATAAPHVSERSWPRQASGECPEAQPARHAENPLGLTPRQMDVLAHLAEDMTNAEIADRLFLSNRTVDHHVSAILGKFGQARVPRRWPPPEKPGSSLGSG